MTEPYKLIDNANVIFCNGRDVIHMVNLEFGQEVISGQPFMVSSPTMDGLLNLFYETYTLDDEGNVIGGTPYPIYWSARFDLEERAQFACDLLNTASSGNVQMKYIKHPSYAEWAVPVQNVILNALPESEAKTAILNWLSEATLAGYVRTREQMVEEGWF